jgi:DNA-binding transcriptional regulator YiaG
VDELRRLRQDIDLSQQEFAALLGVPVNTFRMWDSGLRVPQPDVIARAYAVVAEHQHQHELVSLDVLATEFGMHQRTLRDAVRAGRLEVQLSTRSAFGRPIRHATRAAVRAYQQRYYRRSYSRTMQKPPIPGRVDLPADYAERVTLTRHALRLTLSAFAERIGAANKAVVYQWESGKRKPSSVFWRASSRSVVLVDNGKGDRPRCADS